MKTSSVYAFGTVLLTTALVFAGCGHKEDDHHDHGHGHGHGHGDGHDSDAHEAHGKGAGHGPAGGGPAASASFQAGKGILLTEETRKLLDVEAAVVTQQKLANQIRLTVQVFGEKHHHLLNPEDHTGCDVHGSGFVAHEVASDVKTGQPVQVLRGTNRPIGGVVLAVQKALALGETEVVVGFSNATGALLSGEFVPARIPLVSEEAVLTIPQSALLRTSEGAFVYVVNGEAYLRTAVKVRAEADGWVEVVEGLSPGVRVVTRPVETLWLIELRATKGGGHSH